MNTSKKTIDTNYDKTISKYRDSRTLSEKVSDKKKAKNVVKTVAIKKRLKPKKALSTDPPL